MLKKLLTAPFPYIFTFVVFVSLSECVKFKCEPIRLCSDGYKKSVPAGTTSPLPVPANFSCNYRVVLFKSYLKLTVVNLLSDNDYIQFTDSAGYSKNLTFLRSSTTHEELFAVSGPVSLKIETGPNGNSKALLLFECFKMPTSNWTEPLRKNASGINVDCMDIQLNPITFESDVGENIALNVAHSGYILDTFDSYFVFDGPSTDSNVTGRMSTHVLSPFISSGRYVTVIGLTNRVVYSNILANVKSNLSKYRKYDAAVVIDQYGGPLESINQTIAVTFIAKDSNQLYITSLKFSQVDNELCELRILSGTPSPVSHFLLSYTPLSQLDISFPQQFPSSLFTLEITDCSVYMVVTKNTPADFFMANSERIGYVFTPSFLDDNSSSKLNFTMSSNETVHYSTVVESVSVVDDEQLEINVYNSKGSSAMSVIVTGNQTGGSAEAMGTSVNIIFDGESGQGKAKIRYHISNSSGSKVVAVIIFLLHVFLN